MTAEKVTSLEFKHPELFAMESLHAPGLHYFFWEGDPLMAIAGEEGITIINLKQARALAKEMDEMADEMERRSKQIAVQRYEEQKNQLLLRYRAKRERKNTILKIDKDTGEILARYKSVTEAGQKEHISSNTINKAIRGVRKTAGGFVWRRSDA